MLSQHAKDILAVCLFVLVLLLITIPGIQQAHAQGADSDGDGVSDPNDFCPDTPGDTPVDDIGCPIGTPGTNDDDGDGVSNDADLCPGTPREAPVDGAGCAIGSVDNGDGFDFEGRGDPSDCSDEILDQLLSTGINYILGSFGLTVPTTDIGQQIKDAIEDCVAWATSGAAIEQVTASVVNEINTGFDGNPAYVTGINSTLRRSADDAYLSFIESGTLDDLPRYFRNDTIFSLVEEYNKTPADRLTSTLDEDLYDIEAFVNGDFSQGGWGTWFKLTQQPQNNPYGAFLLAQEALENSIAAETREKELELQAGQLFESKQSCEEVEIGTGSEYVYEFDEELGKSIIVDVIEKAITEQRCKIVTPGSTIKDALEKALGSGVERIAQADELNEGFSSLFTGLTSEILSSESGLSGVGEFIGESSAYSELLPDINDLGDVSGGGIFPSCDPSSSPQPGSSILTLEALQDEVFTVDNQDRRFKIGGGGDGHYTQATYEYDFQPGPFVYGDYNGLGGLRNVATDGESPRCFMGLGADTPGGRLSACEAGIPFYQPFDFTWKEDTWYHAKFTHDTEDTFTTEVVVTERDSGIEVGRASVEAESSLFPVGGGLHATFGGKGDLGHFNGSKFTNVTIELIPGEPFCSDPDADFDGGSPDSPIDFEPPL